MNNYKFSFRWDKDKVLKEYYSKVFEIKKDLNILSDELKKLKDLEDFTVESKPLLLFGDCSEDWIKNNSEDINLKIKSVAYGAFYFGSPCIIKAESKRQRYIF